MSEKTSNWKSAETILYLLGYSVKAFQSFKNGKENEAWKNVSSAAQKAVTNWSDLKYVWDQIHTKSQSSPGNNFHQNNISAAKYQSSSYGFFTGQWLASDTNRNELIFHDRQTNVVYLYSIKSSLSEYTIYQGGIDLENEIIIWTGYNKAGKELIIVGNPDNNGDYMDCDTWFNNPQTGKMDLFERFSLQRS